MEHHPYYLPKLHLSWLEGWELTLAQLNRNGSKVKLSLGIGASAKTHRKEAGKSAGNFFTRCLIESDFPQAQFLLTS